MNIMSFKLKIFGEITWRHSLEALFNQFNNVVIPSSRRVSQPRLVNICSVDKWAVFKTNVEEDQVRKYWYSLSDA